MKSTVVAAAFALCLLPRLALAAEPSAEDTERARTFFNAGAQAYGAARYADAVRSFEQAYAITQRPQILFSLAQAERKEFLDKNEPSVLKRALAHYKEYLEKVPSGGRRAEALDAKAELEGKLARLDPALVNAAEKAEKRKPRVTVYSATPGAQASLDGGPPQELPYFADLEPGKHRIRVFADGYFDAEQEVNGDRGLDQPVSLPLREKPALVTIALSSSADVYVDGRLVATTPLGRPLEVAPGAHIIAIARNGAQPWQQEVVLERAKPLRLSPRLVTSGQRILAYSMLATGGAAVLLGGVFGLAAAGDENKVKEIEDKRTKGNISADELAEHNRLIDRRDDERTTAIVLTSVGAAALAGGALFYFLDKPPISIVPPRSVEPANKKPDGPSDVAASLRPQPLVGPGLYGMGFSARF